jgi:hypothetical protein
MIVKSVTILPNQLEVVGPNSRSLSLQQGMPISFTVAAQSQDFSPVPEGATLRRPLIPSFLHSID